MKTENIFLKRLIIASMIITAIANTAQAGEVQTQQVEIQNRVVVVPKGPARKKYDEFMRYYPTVKSCLQAIAKGGVILSAVGAVATVGTALVDSNVAAKICAMSSFCFMVAFSTISPSIYYDAKEEALDDDARAEEKTLATEILRQAQELAAKK